MREKTEAATVVSTFSGCGGSSLGYKMAGARVLLAAEWDDNAVENYRLNFPKTSVFHGDIRDLTVAEVLRRTGLKPGRLSIFDGSPPCQGFSTAGDRRFDDQRNSLFLEYVRLLKGLRPMVMVMENVSGMTKGKMKIILAQILRALDGAGYNVRARVLNAARFGVPQNRNRIIFIGVRKDLKVDPTHPIGMSRPISIGEALGITEGQWKKSSWNYGKPLHVNRPSPTVSTNGIGGSNHTELLLTDKYGKLYDRVPQGGDASDVIGKGFSSCVKPHPARPSPTITKTQTGHGFATMVHPTQKRALSVEEAMILQSFPPDFKLVGSYSARWARIGNSVPPLMMKAIASHIINEILPKARHG